MLTGFQSPDVPMPLPPGPPPAGAAGPVPFDRPLPAGPSFVPPPGYTPGYPQGYPQGYPPDGRFSAGEPPANFWDDRASRRAGGLFGGPGADADAPRPTWQTLPRLLGDIGPGNSADTNLVTDFAGGLPQNLVSARTSAADLGGDVGPGRYVYQAGIELANADGTGSIGFRGGVATFGGDSAGLAPAVYGKRVLSSSDNAVFGVGLGGIIPTGNDARGAVVPWVFSARQIRGDAWYQGSTTLSVPLSRNNDLALIGDYGLLIPIYGQAAGPRGLKIYFMPELHGSVILSRGRGTSTFAGNDVIARRFGSPDFLLNSTMGFGIRTRGVDVQAGIAFPIVSDRAFDYETILRIGYRF